MIILKTENAFRKFQLVQYSHHGRFFIKKEKYHRDSRIGPACIWANGSIEYWEKGRLHRDSKNGPARIWADGTVEYWENGKRVKI